jgi:hypothetical protein
MALGNGNGNGVHSRQEIRFPLRKIDKEEDVGGRGEGAGQSCHVFKDCHPHLPRSTMAETQTPLFFF